MKSTRVAFLVLICTILLGCRSEPPPIKVGAKNMHLLDDVSFMRQTSAGDYVAILANGEATKIVFVNKAGQRLKTIDAPYLTDDFTIADFAIRNDGAMLFGGTRGFPVCPWVVLVSALGDVEWQRCAIDLVPPIRFGQVSRAEFDTEARPVVSGTVGYVEEDHPARRFRAVLSANRVVGLKYADEEIPGANIITSHPLKRMTDGTKYVAHVRREESDDLIKFRRDANGGVSEFSALTWSNRTDGLLDKFYLDVVSPMRNEDFVVLAHGVWSGELGSYRWRFGPDGKIKWHHKVVGQDWFDKKSSLRPIAAIEKENGEVIVFDKNNIQILNAAGDEIVAYPIKEPDYNHEIYEVFAQPSGGIMLYGRYWKNDGSSQKWLVDLGDWPNK